MSKIRDEKMLFEMIDKRVSIEEELNRFKASVFAGPIKLNKYEALGYSIKLRRETKALDIKIEDKMKEMGIVDDMRKQ